MPGVGSGGRIERNLGDTASDGVGSDRWRAVDLRDRRGRKHICARSVGAGTAPFATVVVTSGGAAALAARSSEDHRHHDGGRKPTFHQS